MSSKGDGKACTPVVVVVKQRVASRKEESPLEELVWISCGVSRPIPALHCIPV